MYSVLILVILFWLATIYPKCMYKSNFFLKFWVLRERSSNIISFFEQPQYSNFKMYSVLILFFFYFEYPPFTKRACIKIIVEAVREGNRERSSVITSFVEQPVFSNLKMHSLLILVFLYLFTAVHPKCFCKSRLFLKF